MNILLSLTVTETYEYMVILRSGDLLRAAILAASWRCSSAAASLAHWTCRSGCLSIAGVVRNVCLPTARTNSPGGWLVCWIILIRTINRN